jgi:O-antigen ligase
VGLLGFRKTALAVAGLVYGCAMVERHRWAAERFIILALTAAIGVSIVAHQWFPSIEQMVTSRDAADVYTGLYDGEARLQGVFAGPFHAAACGVLLVGWALVRWRSSFWLPKAALVLGALGTYLTMVRTAFVAIGLVVLLLVFLSTSFGKFMKRALLVAALGCTGLFFAMASDAPVLDLIGSIADFSTDSRFLNRLPGYDDGMQMFSDSPIWGWGAGSAGDTLGPLMDPGLHVTPHNLLLKIAVEGGLIGLILWSGLIIAVWRAVKPRTPSGRMAIAALGGLFGMGLTGSAIETLPVSYLLFALVGLAVAPVTASPPGQVSAADFQTPPMRTYNREFATSTTPWSRHRVRSRSPHRLGRQPLGPEWIPSPPQPAGAAVDRHGVPAAPTSIGSGHNLKD